MEYKVIEDEYGNIKWYYGKVLHKENGPAVERHDGTKEWWINGELHRDNDPAMELSDGSRIWAVKGKFHREDGPALELDNGREEFWFEGIQFSKHMWMQKVGVCDDCDT